MSRYDIMILEHPDRCGVSGETAICLKLATLQSDPVDPLSIMIPGNQFAGYRSFSVETFPGFVFAVLAFPKFVRVEPKNTCLV